MTSTPRHGADTDLLTAALGTTPDTAGPAAPLAVMDGLTSADTDRITAALQAAIAPSTRTVYQGAWRRWTRWCHDRNLLPLPATPATVCAYLTHRVEQGLTASSIDLDCSAISFHHRETGHLDPITHTGVRQVRAGIRRTLGTAPRRPARPLDVTDIRRILHVLDRDTLNGARDAAIILLGFASALRRSELAALTLADLEHRPKGLLLTINRSKTDQTGKGQIVAVAHGCHALTDPVAALEHWLDLRGRAAGPLFVNIRTRTLSTTPMTGEGIARMLKRHASAAGYANERITGHSLRSGHATTAALAGASLEKIAAQTRHRHLSTLIERYIRPIDALAHTTSSDLGL